jgi:hypothetical protein
MRDFSRLQDKSILRRGLVPAVLTAIFVGCLVSAGCSMGPSAQTLATAYAKPTKNSMPPNLTDAQKAQWIQNSPILSPENKELAIARLQKQQPTPTPKPAGL